MALALNNQYVIKKINLTKSYVQQYNENNIER